MIERSLRDVLAEVGDNLDNALYQIRHIKEEAAAAYERQSSLADKISNLEKYIVKRDKLKK